jgi:hypothetical protein
LTGLPAKQVLSYRRIEKAAAEEGVVLPYFRFADRTWRKILSPAMELARVEPMLEGEEIADAIVAEIRALLEGWNRGESASDLLAGKVIEQRDRVLVSPKTLVGAVRSRLVDDVLPQAAIAEAATAHLGMRQSRPRFSDAGTRPCAWAFPRTALTSRPHRDGAPSPRELENSKSEGEATDPDTEPVPSMDGRSAPVSPTRPELYDLDRLDGAKCDSPQDPVHGRRALEGISQLDKGKASGSNGRKELGNEPGRSGTSGKNSGSAPVAV